MRLAIEQSNGNPSNPAGSVIIDHASGVVLGQGLGELSDKTFRIAHMGHVNAPMVLGTLGVIECALQALGIPHRKGGVEAAIAWLGAQVEP